MRRGLLVALVLCAAACRKDQGTVGPAPAASSIAKAAASNAPSLDDDESQKPKRARRLPNGAPPRLSCNAARALIADVVARLAAPPSPVAPAAEPALHKSLADGALDWADPHGLWTASPDSPLGPMLRARAPKLRAVLDGKIDCAAEMKPLGEAMVRWIRDLRGEYDAAAKEAAAAGAVEESIKPATEGIFEDGALTRPAKTLARELGKRGARVASKKPELAAEVTAGRDRWLPGLDANAWSEVLLAAAVRAYVPLIDPHGAWAPLDESAMLYDRDLELAPPPRLWASATRTALGVRIDATPTTPLEEKDIVLSVDGVTLAGLSAEAIDQLAEAPQNDSQSGDAPPDVSPRIVRVLRGEKIVRLSVRSTLGDDPPPPDPLATFDIPYGEGRALVVRITDVPDALGDDLAHALVKAHGGGYRGVLLDLRGNGGGSIDGATSALGVFLSGAPLFPLKHRDGAIETERATEPPVEDRWQGPVAALVDAGTASAAEMIAGALHAYRRGIVIGTNTYGKGCAQEYVDDVTGSGVLRLTTLLFALPDGSAVQRVGIRPDIAISLPIPLSVKDREAELPRAAPTWSGPDVRDEKRVVEVAWPSAKGVGPCSDEAICRALKALASGKRDVAKR